MADNDGRQGTSRAPQARPQGLFARGRPAPAAPGSRAGRGHLRIYLGSAAGVGKTYAMLGEGHRRAERGTDVVVGFAEAHGRPQTSALLDGLETVPRARLEYRGATFEEMDLDAVLARRPESPWWTSSPTPTSPARATRSAGRTSRSCSTPGST